MSAEEFNAALGRASDSLLIEKRRGHLGASSIGSKCARAAWLGFRWAYQVEVDPRMRRLWKRGHEEEFRFVKWLRAMDIEVRDYAERLMYHDGSDSYVCIPWEREAPEDDAVWDVCDDVSDSQMHIERATARGDGPKQWGFVGHKGHFAGSGDGMVSQAVAKWFPEVAGLGWGLMECKTSNDKSFKDLDKNGVLKAKPEHYVQMQQYMHRLGLRWALYLAVNKNNDDIYPEVIMFREEVAAPYADRAANLIDRKDAPPKLSRDPSWYECKMCDYHAVCHFDEPLERNCRSCVFVSAIDGGKWQCDLYRQTIPSEFIETACEKWESCL